MMTSIALALIYMSFAALPTAAATTEIETVASAYRISDDDCREPHPFTFTGSLLTPFHSHLSKYRAFKDATGGAVLHLQKLTANDIPPFSTVRVKGMMNIDSRGERDFVTTECQLIQTNAPEPAVSCTCADVRAGNHDFCLVRVRGVITAADVDEVDPRFLYVSFRDTSGDVFVTCSAKTFDLNRLRTWVDAEVEVIGLAMPLSGLRHNLGRGISVKDQADIALLKPPSDDPFLSPPLSSLNVAHRQTVTGTVIGLAEHRFFIRTPASRIIPIKPVQNGFLPKIGSNVSVAGFATLDPYRILLSEALVRTNASSAALQDEIASRVAIESLFRDSNHREKISMEANGSILVLQGVSTQIGMNRLILSAGDFSVFIDLTAFQGNHSVVPPNGSAIEVKGLCIADFDGLEPYGFYPKFRHFTIYPTSAADIKVLAKPGWWTIRKLTYGIATLAVLLISILLWNILLRRKSEQRGRELYEEKIDHALAEQKVEERTRLAVELHDSVSQTLTGVALQLDGGEVETAKTMLASCRGELRRCLWDLRSRTFEEKDMTEAVTRTIAPHLNGCTATVRFNVPRERLSESLTHAILRIIRELVVNAIRHGEAMQVRIAGEMHGSTVSFSVSDNGRGFDRETAPGPEQGHFGLLGIRERLEDFNGNLKIVSAPGQGAKFTVTLTTTDETNER